MKKKVARENIRKLLSAPAVPACTNLTIDDAVAQYYTHDKRLSLSWAVNGVDPTKFVVTAVFGFILSGVATTNQPFSYVQYGVRQPSFYGELELPWTTSVPDNASKGFVRLTVADNNLSNPKTCGIELPISILP